MEVDGRVREREGGGIYIYQKGYQHGQAIPGRLYNYYQ